MRELKSTVERAVLVADDDEIAEADLLLGTTAISPWAERVGPAAPAPGASPAPDSPAPDSPAPDSPAPDSPAPTPPAPAASESPSGDGRGGGVPSVADSGPPAAPAAPTSWDDLPPLATPASGAGTAPASGAGVQPGGAPAGIAALAPDDDIVPLDELKRLAVERAFELCDGNVERAATELGIGRATMYRLLKKYDISTD